MSAEPSSDGLFAGPLGAELARRVLDAARAARELLGMAADGSADPDPEALPGLIAGLGALLDDDGALAAHPCGAPPRRRGCARAACAGCS